MDFKKEISAGKFLHFFGDGKPVIFWDACALLDILRIPLGRKNIDTNTLKIYENIAEAIENNNIISVTSYIVGLECNNNYNKIENEMLTFNNKTKENAIRLASFMNDDKKKKSVIKGISEIDVLDKFINLLNRISKNTYIIKNQKKLPSNMYPDRIALDRVLHKEPPASTKGEYKDSYIWSTFVAITKAGAPSNNSVFFTTNTSDYKDSTTQKPFSRLESDISFSSSTFISFSIEHTAHLLNISTT